MHYIWALVSLGRILFMVIISDFNKKDTRRLWYYFFFSVLFWILCTLQSHFNVLVRSSMVIKLLSTSFILNEYLFGFILIQHTILRQNYYIYIWTDICEQKFKISFLKCLEDCMKVLFVRVEAKLRICIAFQRQY